TEIQIDCFFIKKNLSPTVELASESDDMEIKTIPIKIKIKVSNNKGDRLAGSFLGGIVKIKMF
ncbi:MAG TPA: hypothetical protein VF828_01000, partial [Patescibacteria group bacterium]